MGTPRIECDHVTLHLDTRKAIAILAYLAVNTGFQSRDTLAALLWPDSDHAGARGALRRTISTLNTGLGGTGLLIEREAIALDPTAIWSDLTHFQFLLQGCHTHGHSRQQVCSSCRTPLQEAINLYHGDFLQGFSLKDSADFDLWQFQQAELMQQRLSGALERLVHLYCEDGTFEAAAQLAQRWLALDPLHESAHRHLMEIYAWSGQRTVALKQYQDCVRILHQELGVLPLDETTRLHQMIMDNAIHLRTTKHDFQQIAPVLQPKSSQTLTDTLPLVGRDEEIKQLGTLYQRVVSAAKGTQVVVIEGEAGIGKTRLASDFLARVGAFGSRSFIIRSYDNESQTPYAALIRSLQGTLHKTLLSDHQLSELARLLPEVLALRPELRAPISIEGTGAQNRLFEAMCHALLELVRGNLPGVLVFDDLQWVDTATYDLLAYLLRRMTDDRVMLIFTWRAEEVPRTHRLRSLLTDYGRSGGAVDNINLKRLGEKAVAAIIHSTATKQSSALVERLYRESEGLPLFLNEYVVLLRTRPNALDENEWRIPMGILELVRSRLTLLNETSQQILGTAAVLGKTFDIDLLHECSGRNETETTDGLDELLRRGILKELTNQSPSYEFCHEKLREVVYQDLSMARRRLLHKRSAVALLNRVRNTDKLTGMADQIAYHYQHGGQAQEAAHHYYFAGVHARALYANHAALKHFESALALGCANIAEVYQQIGDLYTLLGDYQAAIRSYQTGIAHATEPILPVLERAMGKVYHRLGEWEHAESYFQSAMRLLSESEFIEHAALLTDWSLTQYSKGNVEQAEQLAQSALTIAEKAEADSVIAQAHNMLGILARKHGDFKQAYFHLTQSLRIAEKIIEPGMHAAALNNLALTYAESGEYIEAEKLLGVALQRCVVHGDRHHEAALRNNLADVFHAQHKHDLAMQQLKIAVTLFAQIGVSGDAMKSEIWMLAEW
jgi:predicted ATPase/DNA-binding SARP family transcriptional activator